MILTTIILSILAICIFVYFKYFNTTSRVISGIITKKKDGTIDMKFPSIKPVASKFYPDKLYVGKMLKLDPTLKFVLRDSVMFSFPSDSLIISGFRTFSVDGNEFEEILFDKMGSQDYMALYDSYEQVVYFLHRVTSEGVNKNDLPQMVSESSLTLTENDVKYQYDDFSGLIEVDVSQNGKFLNNRLLRVYSRDLLSSDCDKEFLITIMDNPTALHYYIGCQISIHQLEDI